MVEQEGKFDISINFLVHAVDNPMPLFISILFKIIYLENARLLILLIAKLSLGPQRLVHQQEIFVSDIQRLSSQR